MIDVDKVLAQAMFHVGRGELAGDNDGPYVEWVLKEKARRAWCAAWIMRIHEAAGFPISRDGFGGNQRLLPFYECRRVATMFAELEARRCILGAGDVVAPGDLRLKLGARVRYSGGSGHVDMVTEVVRAAGKRSKVMLVGGNVGDKVARTRGLLWAADVTAYARPSRLLEAA